MDKCFFCEDGIKLSSYYHEFTYVDRVVWVTNKNALQSKEEKSVLFIEYCPFCGRKIINEVKEI